MLVSSCTSLLIYLLNLLICKDLDGTKQWSTGFRFDENCCAPLISWIVIVWLFFVQTPFYSVNWLIGWKTSTNFSSNWRDHMLTSCFVNSRSTMLEQLILLSERESCYFWTCFFFSFFLGCCSSLSLDFSLALSLCPASIFYLVAGLLRTAWK